MITWGTSAATVRIGALTSVQGLVLAQSVISISAKHPRRCFPIFKKLKLSSPNIYKTILSALIYRKYNDQDNWEILLALLENYYLSSKITR